MDLSPTEDQSMIWEMARKFAQSELAKACASIAVTMSVTNQVVFESCRIPKDALLGELNQGFKIAVGELAGGRIGIDSLALGVGLSAMDYARDVRISSIYEDTGEIQKVTIARELLREAG